VESVHHIGEFGCGRKLIIIGVLLSDALVRMTSKIHTFRLSKFTPSRNHHHLVQTVADVFITRGGGGGRTL